MCISGELTNHGRGNEAGTNFKYLSYLGHLTRGKTTTTLPTIRSS